MVFTHSLRYHQGSSGGIFRNGAMQRNPPFFSSLLLYYTIKFVEVQLKSIPSVSVFLAPCLSVSISVRQKNRKSKREIFPFSPPSPRMSIINQSIKPCRTVLPAPCQVRSQYLQVLYIPSGSNNLWNYSLVEDSRRTHMNIFASPIRVSTAPLLRFGP